MLLKNLLDHVSDLVQVMTLDGQLSYVNAAWQDALGYSEAEWERLSGFEVMLERSRSRFRTLLQQVWHTQTALDFPAILLNRQQEEIPVHGHIMFDPGHATGNATFPTPIVRDPAQIWILWRPIAKPLRMTGPQQRSDVCRDHRPAEDWSDRQQPELTLQQREEQLRLALVAANMGTWQWDLIPRKQFWSETLEALFGFAPGEFDGRLETFYERIHPEDLSCIQALDRRIHAIGGEFQVIYRIVLPDGNLRWLRSQGKVYNNAQGQPTRILGVSLDITDAKFVEAQILQALAHERELGELKSRFVSMVSHEVRTPLTTIMSSVDVLQNIPCNETERQELFALIQSSIRRMVQLLEDALSLDLRTSGTPPLQPTPFDLVPFCQRLLQDLQASLGWEHRLQLDWDALEFWVCLDPKSLRQILHNLLSNAIKYSAAGSVVTLRVIQQCDRLQLQIQDQGIGIPPEEQPHLFDDFYRARNVGAIDGTGLGLAIVKTSVERYGGEITVASDLGVGTTFTVMLPLPHLAATSLRPDRQQPDNQQPDNQRNGAP